MILNKYIDNDNVIFEKISDFTYFLRKKISFKSIFFIVLSFLLANQTFITDISPFIYVMFGVASLFDVPLILVLLSSIGAICLGDASNLLVAKVLSFFVLFTLVTSLLNIEGVTKKSVVYIKYILSFSIIELLFSFIQGNFILSIFENIGNILIVSILYFIFAAGIYVILNKSNNFISSKEESVSMVVVLALVTTIFNGVNLYIFSLSNILIMALILIYGWKNGPITACAAGVISGLLASCINDTNLYLILMLGIAGLFSGISSKIGKPAIVISVIIGYVYISYYTNNFSDIIIRVAEMLIASLTILFIPKKLEVKLDNLFNQGKTLNKPYDNMLDSSCEVKEKIGAISEVFESLANVRLENTREDMLETRDVIKKYIENYVEENCMVCKKKQYCKESKNLEFIADYMATKLENNEELKKEMLACNCIFSDKIINDLQEVYSSMKLMRIVKQKEKQNSERISEQYKEISNILNNVYKSIDKKELTQDKKQQAIRNELKMYGYSVYEDEFINENNDVEYTFVTDILTDIEKQKKEIISIVSNILEQNITIKLILNSSKKEKSRIKLVTIPDYKLKSAVVLGNKNDSGVSGDSYLSMELPDLKHVNILSDGAGSGKDAAKGSKTVINLMEKLLSSGFDEECAIKIINSFIKLKGNDTIFSTLDAFIFDMKTAKAQFIKLGAAPTYILKNSKVTTISNMNIPLGLINETDYVPIVYDLDKSSIVVQVTDGVINDEYDYNSNYITKYLQNVDKNKTVKVIGEELYKLILKEKKNKIDDDFTVLVSKVSKN